MLLLFFMIAVVLVAFFRKLFAPGVNLLGPVDTVCRFGDDSLDISYDLHGLITGRSFQFGLQGYDRKKKSYQITIPYSCLEYAAFERNLSVLLLVARGSVENHSLCQSFMLRLPEEFLEDIHQAASSKFPFPVSYAGREQIARIIREKR
ncbi:hypothetical protein ASU35_17905 [Acetivibrio ethanolgignens]|uniref:Uncharacterized protein n=2 Tax=Acetivibrio ethanolgignens TaxID=290052 RepID=A0A0V8QH87_9FIRM|nr:hypothetical protein ASU35_17905 [Acetivibrio ethanolgignens]